MTDGAGNARWRLRAAAFALDTLPGLGLAGAAVLTALTVQRYSGGWYVAVTVAVAALLATVVNRTLVPAVTGTNLGRGLLGIGVVGADGTRPSMGRLLLRDLAHLLDTAALGLGWLWPLWDSRGRTFADLVCGTQARATAPNGPAASVTAMRSRCMAVVLAAALGSVAVTAMGDLSAYRPDQVQAQIRSQLQRQGPEAVAQMLSFNPATLQEDFARAQGVVTDNFRTQLVAQQQNVAKSPVPHEYWVADSAVLPGVTSERATMLMCLQGKAGSKDPFKAISATVTVTLVKSGGRWLVDDLVFVPPPKAPKAGR